MDQQVIQNTLRPKSSNYSFSTRYTKPSIFLFCSRKDLYLYYAKAGTHIHSSPHPHYFKKMFWRMSAVYELIKIFSNQDPLKKLPLPIRE